MFLRARNGKHFGLSSHCNQNVISGVICGAHTQGFRASERRSAFDQGDFGRSEVLGVDPVEAVDVVVAGLEGGREGGREGGGEEG
jgi:hypothetical protein